MLEVFISCLDFGNLIHVLEADGAQYFVSGTGRTLFQASHLLEEVGGWRCFCDKSERPVWLDVNHGGNWDTGLDVGSPGVELLAKVHGFDTARPERWADRRTWRGLSGTNQETLKNAVQSSDEVDKEATNDEVDLFGHCSGVTVLQVQIKP